MNIKCFAFDLGKVIFDFDFTDALKTITAKTGIASDKIMKLLMYNDLADRFDKGLISNYDFFLEFERAFAPTLTYEEFVHIWCDIFTPNQRVINLISHFRKTYPVYLISNINQLHFDYLYRYYDTVFSLFNHLILSFKVRALKPELAIYQALKNIAGVEYENIIYIDDREDLIAAATQLRLNAIQFCGYESLIRRLTAYHVSLPKSESLPD